MDEKRFVCIHPGCGKRYRRHDHLKRHAQCHSLQESERKPFTCPKDGCEKCFTTNYKLQRHLKSSAHQVVDESQRREQHLAKRRLKRLQNPKVHHCSHQSCDFFTVKWSELCAHIKDSHPIQCEVCGKIFSRRYGLKCHLSSVHNPNNCEKVPCPFPSCNKAFASKKSLKIHFLATHENRRPFKCPEEGCGAQFAHKHLLQRHKKVHVNFKDKVAYEPLPAVAREQENLVDEITGLAYTKLQPSRTIPCIYSDCFYKFVKIYDRDRHIERCHLGQTSCSKS